MLNKKEVCKIVHRLATNKTDHYTHTDNSTQTSMFCVDVQGPKIGFLDNIYRNILQPYSGTSVKMMGNYKGNDWFFKISLTYYPHGEFLDCVLSGLIPGYEDWFNNDPNEIRKLFQKIEIYGVEKENDTESTSVITKYFEIYDEVLFIPPIKRYEWSMFETSKNMAYETACSNKAIYPNTSTVGVQTSEESLAEDILLDVQRWGDIVGYVSDLVNCFDEE